MLDKNIVGRKAGVAYHVWGHGSQGRFLYKPQVIHQGSLKVLINFLQQLLSHTSL